MKSKMKIFRLLTVTVLSLLFCGCQNLSSSKENPEIINLNLKFHIMKSQPWRHSSGQALSSWVTKDDIHKSIIPQLNEIYKSANIEWQVESLVEEKIVDSKENRNSIEYILNAKRGKNGSADPKRIPHFYKLMQFKTPKQLKDNSFHIYLLPFTGNTSQGTLFGHNMLVGTWSNKYTKGKKPTKRKLTENLDDFVEGSITQTIANMLGKGLGLSRHGESDVNGNLTRSRGYKLEEIQIDILRREAHKRIN